MPNTTSTTTKSSTKPKPAKKKKKEIQQMTMKELKSHIYRRFNRRTIIVLGTCYHIYVVPKNKMNKEYEAVGGTCCINDSAILVIEEFDTEWQDCSTTSIANKIYKTLRHEIIHAFLNESGLHFNTQVVVDGNGWATNEEMVDWIAIQFPKIAIIYDELGINTNLPVFYEFRLGG